LLENEQKCRRNTTNSHRKAASVVQDNMKPREVEKTEKNRVAKKNFSTLNVCISETV
jgi:hypothetical protein